MDDAVGIGILGAGWITRAHGQALHTLGRVAPLSRPTRLTALAARGRDRGEAMARDLGYQAAVLCDAIIASAAEGRRVRIDEMMAVPDTAASA